MKGLLRNCFLHLTAFALLLLILAGCGAKPTPPPVEVTPPPPPVTTLPPEMPLLLPVMGYSVQVGAFARVENAARLSARLTRKGVVAYYYRERGGLYRVRFGNFTTADQAAAVATQLRQGAIIDSYMVIRPEDYPVLRYRRQEARVRDELVRVAQEFIGVPYRRGAVRPGEGFDCSGLTMMVYRLIGLDMPRTSKEQFRVGRALTPRQLRPGDLLFFRTGFGRQVSHVGIYVGEGLFVHAPGSGKVVSRANLNSSYFRKRYLGSRSYL